MNFITRLQNYAQGRTHKINSALPCTRTTATVMYMWQNTYSKTHIEDYIVRAKLRRTCGVKDELKEDLKMKVSN